MFKKHNVISHGLIAPKFAYIVHYCKSFTCNCIILLHYVYRCRVGNVSMNMKISNISCSRRRTLGSLDS